MKTGIKSLDILLDGGFKNPSLIAIGGRPCMGKTSFLVTLCKGLESTGNKFFYLNLDGSDERIKQYSNCFINKDTLINKKEVVNVKDFCEFVQKNSNNAKVFIIDYLPLLKEYSEKDSYLETSEIIHRLKKCCLENDVTIIFTAPLSRKIEERQGHRPILTDFGDSGAIEEVSDLIFMIYRRDFYDSHDRPKHVELICVKNKYGVDGDVTFIFDREQMNFLEYQGKKNIDEPVEEMIFSAFIP